MNERFSARWWIIGQSGDVTGAPVAISCDDKNYVLFRDQAGAVRALTDICAHRRAPLSLGRVTEAGLIECPYHGWRYDGQSGICKEIPNFSAEETVPRAYRVPAFSVVEQDGLLCLWTGGTAPDLDKTLSRLAILPKVERPQTWSGGSLMAFPFGDYTDLLLDCPAAVLDIAGVTIEPGHFLGDPVVRDGALTVTYAAEWARRARGRKAVPADFSLALRLTSHLDGGITRIDLTRDDGVTLGSAILAGHPARGAISALHWRGQSATEQPALRILPRPHLDAALALSARPYASAARGRALKSGECKGAVA